MKEVSAKNLKVTSHVGRDLLNASQLFRSEAAAVWEYVVNSLQYVGRSVSPRVQVLVKPRLKTIQISDNGAGMDAEGLNHFFQMHAENLERKRGRTGRGKFGTGKSAAFGIGNRLRVETRKKGLLNVVELTRPMIDRSGGDEIPLDWLVQNRATSEADGTTILISEIFVATINTSALIEYIERHLQTFRTSDPQVAVNDHVCVYREPTFSETHTFTPSEQQATAIGDVSLHIKVAQAPLPDADQGVFVTSGVGNLVAIERAGVERKDFGSYLFGEIDVPSLDAVESPIAPYDSTRSLMLNPAHPVVAVLVGFIGASLEKVRSKLVAAAREARKNEEARRLAEEADRIAEILNRDFATVRDRLDEIRAASASRGPAPAAFGDTSSAGEGSDDWARGTAEPGDVRETDSGRRTGGAQGREPPSLSVSGLLNPDGRHAVDPVGGERARKTKPRGGFRVDFRPLGRDEPRSYYDSPILTILINLDHPVVAAALAGSSVEDIAFRRLAYEIAFSEYAMALGYEALRDDPDLPGGDLLYDVRASLNRVSQAAAQLYQ
jgi:hypothetical protein